MTINKIYVQAGLSENEIKDMPLYIRDELDFYGTPAFDKLYNYFCDSGEMPYEVAKARTETPDVWILERLEV
jgi:hypothetical protein